METLTLLSADVLGANPGCVPRPSLTEQLDVLRQRNLALRDENAALRRDNAALESKVAWLEGEVRELRALMAHLWAVTVSLGAVARLQQAQSAALKPVYTEARDAIEKAAMVNMDETGWREDKHRAWLWTVITAALTVFHIDRSRRLWRKAALAATAPAGVGLRNAC